MAQGLIIVLLAGLTAGIIEGPRLGWGSPLIVACFVASVAACVLPVPYERRRREPLIDVRFFRSVPFSGATAAAVAAFGALSGFLFLNTLYLQMARGYSPLAGLLTLPMAGTSVLCAPLSGRLVGRGRARWALVLAGAAIAAGAGRGGRRCGVDQPPGRSGPGCRGDRIVRGRIACGRASTGRFVTASHAGRLVIAACGVLVAGLGLLTTGRWARRSAARTRELLIDPPEDADRDVTHAAA